MYERFNLDNVNPEIRSAVVSWLLTSRYTFKPFGGKVNYTDTFLKCARAFKEKITDREAACEERYEAAKKDKMFAATAQVLAFYENCNPDALDFIKMAILVVVGTI